MKFIPYHNYIEIVPTKKETFIQDAPLEESGIVVAVGSEVKNTKVGDTLYFTAWGVNKTPEIDGVVHYVVPELPEFILGHGREE